MYVQNVAYMQGVWCQMCTKCQALYWWNISQYNHGLLFISVTEDLYCLNYSLLPHAPGQSDWSWSLYTSVHKWTTWYVGLSQICSDGFLL